MQKEETYRAGVDIGGTFTDIVLLGSLGSVHIKKLASTPDDYGRGIVAGLKELLGEIGASAEQLDGVVHATTVATNTVLEDKGAKTGLITTAGFRDVLEIRRIRIPELYNLDYEKPKTLVSRRLRREVIERMGPRGEVRIALDEESVIRAAEFCATRVFKQWRLLCCIPMPTPPMKRESPNWSEQCFRPMSISVARTRYCQRYGSTSAPAPPSLTRCWAQL